jgi:hypothetical protein
MLNQRLAAAKTVAAHLFPTEQLIEDAIVNNARLSIAVVEGRQSAKLPITAGQESLTALASVAAALLEARSQIAAAHACLADDKQQMGLGARSMGDWGECPPAGAKQDAPQHGGLRVVA